MIPVGFLYANNYNYYSFIVDLCLMVSAWANWYDMRIRIGDACMPTSLVNNTSGDEIICAG